MRISSERTQEPYFNVSPRLARALLDLISVIGVAILIAGGVCYAHSTVSYTSSVSMMVSGACLILIAGFLRDSGLFPTLKSRAPFQSPFRRPFFNRDTQPLLED